MLFFFCAFRFIDKHRNKNSKNIYLGLRRRQYEVYLEFVISEVFVFERDVKNFGKIIYTERRPKLPQKESNKKLGGNPHIGVGYTEGRKGVGVS